MRARLLIGERALFVRQAARDRHAAENSEALEISRQSMARMLNGIRQCGAFHRRLADRLGRPSASQDQARLLAIGV
jgi:hypothetical protein